VDLADARRRFGEARLAHLATVRPDGSPHIVPIVFALEQDTLSFAVDDKPKRSRRLQRIANIELEPRVSVLVDAYDEDWSHLWWIRADGRARVVGDGRDLERVRRALAAKYVSYRDRSPPGPAVIMGIERWRFWPDGKA
jgi:PPOX class probable F420-dependent enzyme